jgi:hypothetical protein
MATLQDLIDGKIDDVLPDVKKINLNSVCTMLANLQYRQYFLEEAGVEHYKLLGFVASLFPGQTIYDIGTHFGGSSVALSSAAETKTVSYDIVEMKQMTSLPKNVEYKIGDFRENPDVLTAPFIFVDVDPHDGIQERDFHKFFVEKNYKGIVLWDDIRANEYMKAWWNNVEESETVKKVDLTKLGHWSGTGMIIYG